MMTEHVKRFLSMLVEALLGRANCDFAPLAAVPHEVESYSLAYDEADSLEASGKPQLARLLRAELEQTIGTVLPGRPAREQALDVDGNHRPFALEPPRAAEPGPSPEPAGERTATAGRPARRRRGRPPGRRRTKRRQSRIPSRERRKPPGTTPTRSDIIMGRKRLTLAAGRGLVSMLRRIVCAVVLDVSASTFASAGRCHRYRVVQRRGARRTPLLTRKLSWAIVAFSDTTQVLFPLRARHGVGGASGP